jgi:hypothetical protein
MLCGNLDSQIIENSIKKQGGCFDWRYIFTIDIHLKGEVKMYNDRKFRNA